MYAPVNLLLRSSQSKLTSFLFKHQGINLGHQYAAKSEDTMLAGLVLRLNNA
jgi:hypothetical protein